MKTLTRAFLILAVVLLGLSASSNAQTVTLNGIGSSAQFLELGEGAQSGSIAATCLWTTASGVTATDTSSGTTLTDSGQAWIAWTPGGGSCEAPGSSTQIYAYLQTDSVVGDRCLFNAYNSSSCKITNSIAANAATANIIFPTSSTSGGVGVETSTIPSAILTALNTPAAELPNFAGTDIRPEDAEFAITRATGGPTATSSPACGSAITQYTGGVGNATQYLYLGYTNGSKIVGFTGSTFNVINFALPSAFAVTPLGATPIVVAVHGPTSGSGLNNTNVTNLNRSTLALFLDGSIGQAEDASTPGTTITGGARNVTVFVREPLSGTYNTMEYNIPNNVELQTSQDVGVNQVDISAPLSDGRYNRNCNATHTGPEWNASGVAMGTLIGNPKERAIGTGQELSDTFGASTDALGYAFWSASNFKNANAGGVTTNKYLTVDGVDPLGTGTAGVGGGIPTSATALANVTLAHVADGTYPIWSLLRLVSAGSTTAPSAVTNLAEAAQAYVTASNPDFVPYDLVPAGSIPNLAVERAHFTPPGIYASGSQPTLQNGIGGLFTEAGGDVGGLPIPYQADTDYCAAYSSGTCTAGHSFTSTQAPSSSRRQ